MVTDTANFRNPHYHRPLGRAQHGGLSADTAALSVTVAHSVHARD